MPGRGSSVKFDVRNRDFAAKRVANGRSHPAAIAIDVHKGRHEEGEQNDAQRDPASTMSAVTCGAASAHHVEHPGPARLVEEMNHDGDEELKPFGECWCGCIRRAAAGTTNR